MRIVHRNMATREEIYAVERQELTEVVIQLDDGSEIGVAPHTPGCSGLFLHERSGGRRVRLTPVSSNAFTIHVGDMGEH